MATTPDIITAAQFEAQTAGAYVVHIAGKGNMPTDLRGEDGKEDIGAYSHYMHNYPHYASFAQQAAVFHDLDTHVLEEFANLLCKLQAILEGRRMRAAKAAALERLGAGGRAGPAAEG